MIEFLSCRPNLETDDLAAAAAFLHDVLGFDVLHDQYAARGAPIVTSLTDHPWGLLDFVVEMPGGHRIAFGERISRP